MNREQLARVVINDDTIPADWDSLSDEEQTTLLLEHENDEAAGEEASGGLIGEAERLPRTMAFTVLALGQIFHVMAIHAGDRISFFKAWFSKNQLLLIAVISTFLLQLGVVYLPFLQATFETAPLAFSELLITTGLASLILIAVEIEKLIRRSRTTPS
jgi:magnesium-transporting ATPase (P-type)